MATATGRHSGSSMFDTPSQGQHQQQQPPPVRRRNRGIYRAGQQVSAMWLMSVLLAWALLVAPATALPLIDISIGPPTAKTASISYTWQLAASVVPQAVNMPFSEPRSVTWVINASRTVTFVGSLTGSVRLARPLTSTGAVQWSAVGVSVRQGSNLYLSTNAVCSPGNQFLAMGSSSDYLAQTYAVVNCNFNFGPNLGPGANAFSPGGLPPELLGEASTNKVFELAANITLSSGQVEQATSTQSFSFDLTAPAGGSGSAITGDCATVRDTFAQYTIPVALTFTPPTDGVSNPAVPTGNPAALQQKICAAANFAYVMTIPPTNRVCGDFVFTAGASLSPINSNQGDLSGASNTRTARATIAGCDQAAPGTPGVPALPGTPAVPGVPAVPGAPGVIVQPPVVVPPVIPQPVVTPVVVPPPAPVITPVVQPAVVPPPVITPVIVPPPAVVPPPAIQPIIVPPQQPAVVPVIQPPPVIPPQQVVPAMPQPAVPQLPQPQPPTPAPVVPPAAAAAVAPAPAAPSSQPNAPAGSTPGAAAPSAAAPAGGSPGQPSGGTGGTSASAGAAPALASNSSGGVSSDPATASSGGGAASPLEKYVAPVLPTAAPQPLLIRITSVGGYQVDKQGYVWSAQTKAAPEQLFLRAQGRSRITFSVDYRKVSLGTGAYVIGSVMITNPNAQIANAPGLTVTVGDDSEAGSRKSDAGKKSDSGGVLEAQVDCMSGQGNQRSAVPFKVPSGGSISCTFIAQLPSSSSSSDGGRVTAAIGTTTLGASRSSYADGSTSDSTPWAFAPRSVAAGGNCARVTASISPTDDKLQIVGPADSLTGEMVPAAGKVICNAASFNFSGEFGPIGAKAGRRCGAQAILQATVKPQDVPDPGLAAAITARGTTIVPIDEPGCQPSAEGDAAGAAADDGKGGNPAVQALKVDIGELAPTSVTEYVWRVKYAMKPAKTTVKFSENVTVKSELEVTRSVSSFSRRLTGVVNINNPSDKAFTVLDVRVNATLSRPKSSNTSRTRSGARSGGSSNQRGGGNGGSNQRKQGSGTRGRRKLLLLLQSAVNWSAQQSALLHCMGSTGEGFFSTGRALLQSSSTDLLNAMMGRNTGSQRGSNDGSSGKPGGSSSSSGSNAPPAARGLADGPSVSGTVVCPTDKQGATALPAASKRSGGFSPSSVSCKFTIILPAEATLETTGKLLVAVVAAPAGGGNSSSPGRVRGEASFSMKNSKPQTVGSCARVSVAPATQPLAPSPINLLKTRPLPAAANSTGSKQQQQQQQRPAAAAKAPDAEKVCDSTTYSFDELVGPVKNKSCGPHEVVGLATAEPESSSQGAAQVLASTSITFNGCNTSSSIPTITLNNLKVINFTTFTWTLTQNVTTAKGVSLIPASNDTNSTSRSSGSSAANSTAAAGASTAAAAAAASTSVAAVNASASPFLSHRVPGVLVVPLEKNVSEELMLVSTITRLPGVDNALFGLEGQLVASAPGKDPMEVTGLRVAIASPGDEMPQLIPVICPPTSSSNSSSSNSTSSSSGQPSNSSSATSAGAKLLPPSPSNITCSFNWTTTTPTAGLVTGVVLMPAAAVARRSGNDRGTRRAPAKTGNSTASDVTSRSSLGVTQGFRFSPDGWAVKQSLGACLDAADVFGMEARTGDDLLLPPVRGTSDIGLPQLLLKDSSGKNATLLPMPKALRGGGLPNKTQLCDSRVLNISLQLGPFDNKTCGSNSQFFAATRVEPTPLQPKGLTREFVLPVDAPCTMEGAGGGKNFSSQSAFIRWSSGQSGPQQREQGSSKGQSDAQGNKSSSSGGSGSKTGSSSSSGSSSSGDGNSSPRSGGRGGGGSTSRGPHSSRDDPATDAGGDDSIAADSSTRG